MILWKGVTEGAFHTREFVPEGYRLSHSTLLSLSRLVHLFLVSLRERLGPVTITSGIRSVDHNERVGGLPTSRHLYLDGCCAADIVVAGMGPRAVARIVQVESLGAFDRLCAYPLKGHLHVDLGPLGEPYRGLVFLDEGEGWQVSKIRV